MGIAGASLEGEHGHGHPGPGPINFGKLSGAVALLMHGWFADAVTPSDTEEL